jgi:hypothetical protein
MSAAMPRIDIVYFNAGGGHRATAHALRDVVARQRRPWDVRLVNLVEVLDPQRRVERILGMPPEDLYNRRLRRGWTLGMAQELKLWQSLLRTLHKPVHRALTQHWARSEPDLVLSVVPNFNRVLCESLQTALPGAPFVTLMTDLADHPPHFWIEPGLPQTLLCPTAKALHQARQAGYGAEHTALLSGVVLRPSLYPHARGQRAVASLAAHGLDAARPTGIVMFGGHGAQQMVDLAKGLNEHQLVFVCGHNEALRGELAALRRRAPHAALGFVEDIGRVLQMGDYFIGKPGPGALSEALLMGLPVLTCLNSWTLPQERFNAQWIRDEGLGVVVPSWTQAASALTSMLKRLPEHQRAVRRLDNRAVFEVPELLAERLMASALLQPQADKAWAATAAAA